MLKLLLDNSLTRTARPSDHQKIIDVQNEWWGGRDLTVLLPRLFLDHFFNTSFVLEKDDVLIAFLIGFLSPARTTAGYIHFAGVHPNYRGMGIGNNLYHQFFALCLKSGRDTVRACTSPENKKSIEFHKKLGFQILPGNSKNEGVAITLDYNRPNDPKVLFEITL